MAHPVQALPKALPVITTSILLFLFSQSSYYCLPVTTTTTHSVESSSEVHHLHPQSHRHSSLSRAKPLPPPPQPSSSSSSASHLHSRAQIRLKSVVPVDLYNPCSMEDENWSETYLFDQSLALSSSTDSDEGDLSSSSRPLPPIIDEKYSLADVPAEEAVNHDLLLTDQQSSSSSSMLENVEHGGGGGGNGQVKVTQLISSAPRHLVRTAAGHHLHRQHRDRFGLDLLKEMLEKAAHLQGLVTDMIRKVSGQFLFSAFLCWGRPTE